MAQPRPLFAAAPALAVLVPLGASLVANLLLSRLVRRYFRESQETRLDPAGLWHYENAPIPASDTARPRLILFGDSRIEMWNPPPGGSCFEVLNRGIGSQTTGQVLARFNQHVAALHPDVVMIQAGVNDLKNIGTFPERADWIVDRCIANLAEIARRSAALGAHVIMATVFPHGPIELLRRPVWSKQIADSIRTVNAALFGIASPTCIVFDAWSLLAHGDRVARQYEIDALHINPTGYAALNTALDPVLHSLSDRIAAEARAAA